MFGDSSPDRWGRMLMKRRLERDIREGIRADGTQLYESIIYWAYTIFIGLALCVIGWKTKVNFSITEST
jgi:hypothetical protein